ncbi:hypothetical protein KSP40_PGU011328 [Platanthera guangdongensis]|uniref:Uncharacterized protein n=1 Tax=Platanthera guangdongensis TaxID=2320717 RepID=A0ABR2MGG4_9ASPA
MEGRSSDGEIEEFRLATARRKIHQGFCKGIERVHNSATRCCRSWRAKGNIICQSGALPMAIATTLCHSALYYIVLFFIPHLPALSVADEFAVASHPSLLRLAPGRPVEDSPGARPGAVVTCNRVHLRGLSRLRDLDKFFHALKLTASVPQGDGLFRIQTVEICLHRYPSTLKLFNLFKIRALFFF